MDLALRWDRDLGVADLAIENDDIAVDEGLETAVIVSLFSDRRVESEPDPRGWWGTDYEDSEDDEMGSRLWLFDRAKLGQDSPERVREYAREALAWMIEDGIASAVDVTAEIADTGVDFQVTIKRPESDELNFRFAAAWRATLALA